MKLNITLILLSLCVLGLNAQLFESLMKKPNLRINSSVLFNNKPNNVNFLNKNKSENKEKSLFENFYQKNENKIEQISTINGLNNNKKPLFEDTKKKEEINEKIIDYVDRKEIDDRIESFLEKSKKISSKISKNKKTLTSLNDRIQQLMSMNKDIKDDIDKYKSLSLEKGHLKSKFNNFLEKYEGEVRNIKSSVINKSKYVEHIINEKSMNIEKIYKEVNTNFSDLQTEVNVVKEKLNEIVFLNFNLAKIRKREIYSNEEKINIK